MEMKNDDGQHVDLGSSRNPDDTGKKIRGRRRLQPRIALSDLL